MLALLWLNGIHSVLLLVGTVIVAITVRHIRKRKDAFLSVVLFLNLIYGLCFLAVVLIYGPKYTLWHFYGIWDCFIITSIAMIALLTAHFIFAVQYFKTSLILPKLFTKTKIEWL